MNKVRDIRNIALGIVLTASGLSALAAINLTTFTPNTPIKSSEVNANFSSLKASLEALEAAGSAGYSAGTGLVLTEKTFSVNTSMFQKPILGECSGAGNSIKTIAVDGSVVCESNRTIMGNTGSNAPYAKWYSPNPVYPLAFGIGNQDRAHIRVQDNSATESFMQFDTVNPSNNTLFANLTLFSSGNSRFNGQLGGTCSYNGGAGWNCTSDRNKKEHFKAVNAQAVLAQLAKLPITRWNMKGDRQKTPHMGPVAQDFKAAFGLGEGNTTINTADAQGVALAAIKGVYEKNQALENKVKTLEARLKALEQAISER